MNLPLPQSHDTDEGGCTNLYLIAKGFLRIANIFALTGSQVRQYLRVYLRNAKAAIAESSELSAEAIQDFVLNYIYSFVHGSGGNVCITLKEYAYLTSWRPIAGISEKANSRRKRAIRAFVAGYLQCLEASGYEQGMISCEGLGRALKIANETALLHLRAMQRDGLIRTVAKGKAGVRGKATEYALIKASEENDMSLVREACHADSYRDSTSDGMSAWSVGSVCDAADELDETFGQGYDRYIRGEDESDIEPN